MQALLNDFKDRIVLVAGGVDIHEVGLHYGLKRCVNTSEIIAANPTMWPFDSYHKILSDGRASVSSKSLNVFTSIRLLAPIIVVS